MMDKHNEQIHNLTKIKKYLENNKSIVIKDWFELIEHVSVSATGEGIEQCCDWLKRKMESLHITVTKYPIKPYPILVGRIGNNPSKKTILLYAHYDVKPAGDLTKWITKPFEPTIIEGKVYARGSADNKSPLMAHLEAVSYYQNNDLEIPVNLIFLFEGCEEEGSQGLEDFLVEHKADFQADLVFFSDGPKDPSGLPIIALGAKGDLSVCIKAKTMNRNIHARYAPVMPSAAWQLVDVLNKLKKGNKVLVPGFYDGIIPLNEKEKKVMETLPSSEKQLNKMYQAKSSHYGSDFYIKLLGEPTFNICSLQSGGNGVVPAEAEAIIDIRLVQGQTPEKIFGKIKEYVNTLKNETISLEMLGGISCSKTDIDTIYLPIIEKATENIYGKYIIYPCRPSSAPDYLWTKTLELPAIQVRWSDADSDNHAPNEHLSIKEYLSGIALTISVFKAVGEM